MKIDRYCHTQHTSTLSVTTSRSYKDTYVKFYFMTYFCLLSLNTVTSVSDLPLHTVKCCTVVFDEISRLLVINKNCRLSATINKLRRLLLPAMSVIKLPRSGGIVFITSHGRSIDNTQWSQIMVENSDFFILHLHSTLPLWVVPVGILPWHLVWKNCGYPGSKNYKDMFIPFDRMHQRDGRTEGQTDTVRRQPALMHSIVRQCFLDARKRLRKIQHFSSGTIISGRSSFWQTTNFAYFYFRYRAIVHGLSHTEKFAGR